MFGYVTPDRLELKVRDYEVFKAYYCGLCKSIKLSFGNLPRMSLNYDMTFLAILINSLEEEGIKISMGRCFIHPIKKRGYVENNNSLKYASFCNVILTFFKLVDNINDDKSFKSYLSSLALKGYLKKDLVIEYNEVLNYVEKSLKDLTQKENDASKYSLDEISHPFADLTGVLISSYFNNKDIDTDIYFNLYWLGYNLGKWIYIIDAFDDLEDDMKKNKFNVIEAVYNVNKLNFEQFKNEITEKVDFILTSCASSTMTYFNTLKLTRNKDLLFNILQYGLMLKMDQIFKRSDFAHEKSI